MKKLTYKSLLTVLLSFILLFTMSTAASADTLYTVKAGDTLFRIAQSFNVTVSAIMSANNLTNPNLIVVGQQLTIPDGQTPTTPPENPTQTPPPSTPSGTHTVKTGETLYSISRLYGVSVQAIAQANSLVNINTIYPGQQLTIPGGGGNTPTPTEPPTTTPPPTSPPTGLTTYTVKAGDTLGRIATQFGVTVNAILQVNSLSNPNVIYVGQVLNIPGGNGGGGGNTPPPAGSGSIPIGFLFGGQTQSFSNPDRMNYAGMEWVKFQHKWSPGDSASGLQGLISNAHNQGFKVLLSIPGAEAYPRNGIDFGSYTNFLRDVASLGDPPDAIEIWNEMNIDFEWPEGQINPSSYVQNMLAPGYNAIKGANSSILVISGAPAPTGFDNGTNAWADDRYMAGVAAAGGANYMDCIGIHYNAGATAPSASSGHPANSSHYSWYYQPMIATYYNAFGGQKPVCFTELGYLSDDGFPSIPANFSWADGNSVSEHAAWLAEAVQSASTDSRVKMVIVFNVDFTYYDVNGDPQAGYAMIRPDGSCPACDTLRNVTGGR